MSGDMDKGVVIVSESGNESSNSSRDVLRVGVIFKIFMVRVDCDRVRGPHQEVAVSFQTSHNREEFLIVDGIVLFGGCKCLQVVTNGAGFPLVVELYKYCA